MTKLPNNDETVVFSRVDLLHLGEISEGLLNVLRHLACLSPEAHRGIFGVISHETFSQSQLGASQQAVKALVALAWADYQTCHFCQAKIAPGEDHGHYYHKAACFRCVDKLIDAQAEATGDEDEGVCPFCGGLGHITRREPPKLAEDLPPEKCPSCKGSGKE